MSKYLDLRIRRNQIILVIPVLLGVLLIFTGRQVPGIAASVIGLTLFYLAYRKTSAALPEDMSTTMPSEAMGAYQQVAPPAQAFGSSTPALSDPLAPAGVEFALPPATIHDPWADWLIDSTKYIRGLEKAVATASATGNFQPLVDERTLAGQIVSSLPQAHSQDPAARAAVDGILSQIGLVARATSTPDLMAAATAASALISGVVADQHIQGWVANNRTR